MRIYISQLRQELTVMIRNGEQLLLLVVIPVTLLVFFSQTDFLPTGNENKMDFLLPGILSLAAMMPPTIMPAALPKAIKVIEKLPVVTGIA